MRARIWVTLLALTIAAGAGVRGQGAHEPAQPSLTQRVSVSVDGRDGRPVTGLKLADFTLTIDDVRQPITELTARGEAPRSVAILLDEFHVSPDATAAVREAAHRFVEQLRPDDRAVVLKPLDSLPAIYLTADRDRLHDAINAFEGRKGLLEPRSTLEEQTIGRAPALVQAARAQVVLSGLRALASRLGAQRGRTGIILVSEGFTRDAHMTNARALPDESVVERFANRFDVPVFVVDPSPLAAESTDTDTLEQLALQTGGFLARGADLAAALQRAGLDMDSGYQLTFATPHGADGRFHRIAVTTSRKNVTVRTRSGYVAPLPPSLRRALPEPPPLTTRLQRRSPFIDVWSGITRFNDAEGLIAVTWEPGRGPTGSFRSPATRVSLVATQPNGTILFQGVLSPVRTTPIQGSNVVNRAEFEAPIGRVYLDMTIFGPRGEKLDIDARDLEVPAAGPVVQLLPPVIVAARSAREFREVTEDHDAAPEPGREFSRTNRLLIRVPSYGGSGSVSVSARLLNRTGQTLRTLDVLPNGPDGVTQFDLPLAPFAPGDYYLLLRASGSGQPVEQRVPLRVTG